MKKFVAIAIVAMMLMGLGVSAMAATITVSPVNDYHAVMAYQLISITPAVDADPTANPPVAAQPAKYEFISNGFEAFIKNYLGMATTSTATQVFMRLSALDNVGVKALALALEDWVTSDLTTYSGTSIPGINDLNGSITVSGDYGWYLILDATEYNEEELEIGDVLPILAVVASDLPITLKSDTYTIPTKVVFNKTIWASNTTVDIGEIVDFKITVEIPNFAQYDAYNFIVYDIMDTALVFDSTHVAAKIDGYDYALTGAIATATQKAEYEAATGRQALTVTQQLIVFNVGNLVGNNAFAGKNGTDLVITYSAKVDGEAIYTANGVANNDVVVLENSTYVDGDGTTTKTYGFEIRKTNEFNENLPGAVFNLYRNDEAYKAYAKYLVDLAAWEEGDPELIEVIKPTALSFTLDETVGIYFFNDSGIASLTSLASGKVTVFGLAAGEYVLEEITAPYGYNLLTYTIDISIGGQNDGLIKDGGNVVNNAGIVIPGTGGIGTTLFIVIGSLVILGGAALLIVNRKRVFGK